MPQNSKKDRDTRAKLVDEYLKGDWPGKSRVQLLNLHVGECADAEKYFNFLKKVRGYILGGHAWLCFIIAP